MAHSGKKNSKIIPSSLAQDMENMSEDDGWEFVNLGDQQSFGIKTAGLEEKATACQMLVSTWIFYFDAALWKKKSLLIRSETTEAGYTAACELNVAHRP